MKLTFIGTASGLTVIDRAHASLLLESGEEQTLIDCGEGATRSLLNLKLNPNNINRIIVSHTHPDHCAGIPVLIQYMFLSNRITPLEIYLPQGASRNFLNYLHQLYLFPEKLTFNYVLNEFTEGAFLKFDVISLEAISNLHLWSNVEFADKYDIGVTSFSILIQQKNKSVFYSADLRGIEDLHAPNNTDLLIIEATHIPVENALKLAVERQIKRVIFTHLPPDIEANSRTFQGVECDFAYDGMEINI
jgi:ribonuclease BN (tRNA processing enzyme)